MGKVWATWATRSYTTKPVSTGLTFCDKRFRMNVSCCSSIKLTFHMTDDDSYSVWYYMILQLLQFYFLFVLLNWISRDQLQVRSKAAGFSVSENGWRVVVVVFSVGASTTVGAIRQLRRDPDNVVSSTFTTALLSSLCCHYHQIGVETFVVFFSCFRIDRFGIRRLCLRRQRRWLSLALTFLLLFIVVVVFFYRM